MHLIGFIIRIYHDARSPECQTDYHLPDYTMSRPRKVAVYIFTAAKVHFPYGNYVTHVTYR